MIRDIRIEDVLFIDIETVPCCRRYEDLPGNLKALWDKKASHLSKSEEETPETLFPRAGIYAEFGKIICISAGFYHAGEFRIKSFYGDEEKEILSSFSALLITYFSSQDRHLCAHNGKEFDFLFLSRRMLVNGIPLPDVLDNAGKKPWEVKFLDTMELWRFGDYKSYTSLELLTTIFGIENPKDDIEGSDVWRIYWEEKDLERIRIYCQKDVLSIAQLYLRYQQKPLISPDKVHVIA